ncbi:DUF4287 domain-containing protein [Kocuria soli]|uniref:DUF4287 domain-containing protein n=2 Tax=Kocuria soli TaxID=2485125 RepID=A0A3N3ZZ07_9MICC|nr:DUF4287 domain-containing protein [Kocuria soli]
MMSALAASMADRTGRTVEQWVEVINDDGPDPLDQKAVRAWLKSEHGLPQNTQWTLADAAARAAGWVPPSTAEYVDALYSGKKATLRPLHDAVRALALSLGADVTAEGRGTYIPFVRRTQFAAVAPGPYGRLRVGVRLRAEVPTVQGFDVEPAKSFAQATHWVHLPPETAVDRVAELEPLLRAAYDQNG